MRPEVNVMVKVTQNGMHHSAILRGIPNNIGDTSNNIEDMLWTQ